MDDGGFCIVVVLLLIPAIAVITSIMKQSEEENIESLNDNTPKGYKRLNLSNTSSYNNGYNQNNYRQNNQSNYQNNYNNRNYNPNYNNYTQRNTYGQNNYGQQVTAPQSEKLSLYFVCSAPVNIEKYQSYIIELVDDHDRNIYISKNQNRLNKFKLAKVVFNEISERYYLSNRNQPIGQGMALIKKLRIKFLLGQKVRLEISLPLPFTYRISINNPSNLFNVSLKDRVPNNNIGNEFIVNVTRNDMNLITGRENAVQEPPKEKKQKVISIDSFASASDEELISKLFNADYINKKQNVKSENIFELNTDDIDFSNIELIDQPAQKTSYKYSPSSEDQNVIRSRISSKREKQEEDIFATSTTQEKKQKSSYEEYLEQQKAKELDKEVELIEEVPSTEEVTEVENENIFENGYPAYEGSNNEEEYYEYYDEAEEEYEYEDEENDYEEEYIQQVPAKQVRQVTEQPQKKVKEEVVSDNISNIDRILNKYVKSKPKFKTRSYTPSTYKSSLGSYSSKLSSYSSKADSISKSISSRTSSISSRIKSRFNKDNKVKESTPSNISTFSSKYLNKYSKYTKFGA